MLTISLFVIGGLVLLAVGAEGLVRGSTSIALRLGVTPLVIGLTVVAFGTGSPELSVSVEVAYRGNTGIALGNVVGSNISNILLILGVAALIRPFEVQSLRPLDVGVLVGNSVLVLPMMWRGSILNRWEGAVLLAGYVVYLYTLIP